MRRASGQAHIPNIWLQAEALSAEDRLMIEQMAVGVLPDGLSPGQQLVLARFEASGWLDGYGIRLPAESAKMGQSVEMSRPTRKTGCSANYFGLEQHFIGHM